MSKLEQLLLETVANGRVCPQPAQWNELWKLLPDRKRVDGGWDPPLPLTLGAWASTSDAEKRECSGLHLRWAAQHGALQQVADYLNTLQPGNWHTAPVNG